MRRRPRITALVLAVAIAASAAVVGNATDAPDASARPSDAAGAKIARAFDRLPLAFGRNRGQAAKRARFVAQGPGYGIALERRGFELALSRKAKHQKHSRTARLAVSLRGARGAALRATHRLPGTSNYMVGADRSRWASGVHSFAEVAYRHPWPGIDALLDGRQKALRYDFLVHPGADPGRIAIGLRGAHGLRVDRRGQLVFRLGGRRLVQPRPRAFQRIDGRRHRVAVRYVLHGDTVQLRLGHYDRSRPLSIDPTLDYSTYLGGSALDLGGGIAVDPSGSAYVTGGTPSINFPTTTGAFQTSFGGGSFDAFVTKLNPTGSALVYSTYLGGSNFDQGNAIALDSSGSAYLTGRTDSVNFPTTVGAFQTSPGGNSDTFAAKLNPTGSALAYSTYLGGLNSDVGNAIALDSSGSAYLTGRTDSVNFPTTVGAFQTSQPGTTAAFATKLNPSGSALAYSTYLGGSGGDDGLGIAVDSSGSAYLTGATTSADFPTTLGAFQTTFGGGGEDAFATKFNASGSAPTYSTYLGGSNSDFGGGIAVDSSGSAYLTGGTGSTNFPTTAGAFQTSLSGPTDATATKLNPSGTAPAYSTYLGGSSVEQGVGIAVDSSGSAYLTGQTNSANFPTTADAFQTSFGGALDAYATKLSPSGAAPTYSTYLGGSGTDQGSGIAVDSSGSAYLIGSTTSTDFPTTVGAFQAANAGSFDAFVTTFALRHTLTVANSGSGSGTVTSTDGQIACTATCSHRYDDGTIVTLNATAASDSTFAGWSGGGCSGTGPCTVTVNSDLTVTATFTKNAPPPPTPQRTLTVSNHGSGFGTVISDDHGIDCFTTCSHDYDEGSQVTLTAYPSKGATFLGFHGGGCSGRSTTCTVTMNTAQTVFARFEPAIADLRLAPSSFPASSKPTPLGPPTPKAKTGTEIRFTLGGMALVHFAIRREPPRPNHSGPKVPHAFNRRLGLDNHAVKFTGTLGHHTLKPGNYKLHVRAIDEGNGYRSPRASAKFTVLAR
jgi:hypothetical protein